MIPPAEAPSVKDTALAIAGCFQGETTLRQEAALLSPTTLIIEQLREMDRGDMAGRLETMAEVFRTLADLAAPEQPEPVPDDQLFRGLLENGKVGKAIEQLPPGARDGYVTLIEALLRGILDLSRRHGLHLRTGVLATATLMLGIDDAISILRNMEQGPGEGQN